MNTISIRDLSKSYGPVRALSDFSIDIEKGSVFGLLGPNGAGKTTAFKCMLGLARPGSGTVLYDGAPLEPRNFERIGYVPERSVLYDWMTVGEHLEMQRRAFSLIPAYLETPESEVRNYMDYGVQLGRRFRGLKLWFVLRAYGRRRMVEIIRNHVAWAQELARWIGEAGDFETLAPHPLSVVCFRHLPARLAQDAGALDQHNQRVVDELSLIHI